MPIRLFEAPLGACRFPMPDSEPDCDMLVCGDPVRPEGGSYCPACYGRAHVAGTAVRPRASCSYTADAVPEPDVEAELDEVFA